MEKTKRYAGLYEWVEIITTALIAITLIFTFLFRLVNVDGTSMETTLHDRERLILSCLPYTPERGDIVVISRGADDEPLIKRVIGLAGDTVGIDSTSGKVYLNGKILEEPYIHVSTSPELMKGEVTVPEGMVFVLGDNRGVSLDSRSQVIGPAETKKVLGKVIFRLFPNTGVIDDGK